MISRCLGSDDIEIADIRQNRSLVLIDLKEFEKAGNELEISLQQIEKILGKNHPKMGFCLHKFGLLCAAKNDLKQSESFFQQSLTILNKSLDRFHPEVADVLISLGELQVHYDTNAAVKSFISALKIIFFCFGKNHYKYSSVCHSLSSLGTSIPEFTKPVAVNKGLIYYFKTPQLIVNFFFLF